MPFCGWTKRKSTKKQKPADNVALDKVPAAAMERVSDLEKDSRWPSASTSTGGSPTAIRKKLEKLMLRNLVPCEVVPAGDRNRAEIFQQRGYDLVPRNKTEQQLQLGKGGFGYVRLISGRRHQRMTLNEMDEKVSEDVLYACKVIEENTSKKKPFEKRVRELANELMGLNAGHSHPNIIQLYDAFIVGSSFFIIMDYAASGTLHRYSERWGPLHENRTRNYFLQIGNAVNFLHAQNIAHRDIKLKNVLLQKEHDPASGKVRRVCKLSDMGLADTFWDNEKGPKRYYGVAGTLSSFSPELLEISVTRSRSLSYEAMPCDIWALGVCLYEMLCRSLPFNTGTESQMLSLQKKRNFSYNRKSGNNKNKGDKTPLSEDVKHLIRMIFDPDPVSRWTWREISHHPWILTKEQPNLSTTQTVTKTQTVSRDA